MRSRVLLSLIVACAAAACSDSPSRPSTQSLSGSNPDSAAAAKLPAATAAAPAVAANECATPGTGWVFCDDFESDRLAAYYEYDNAGGKFARATTTGVGGSVGMRATYTSGQSSAGHLSVAFGRTPSATFRPADAGTANYRDIYWRFFVKRDAGWVGNGADKLTQSMIIASANQSQAMIAHSWTSDADNRYLMLDPTSGTTTGGTLTTVAKDDYAHMRWLGGPRSAAPEEDQAHVGMWACYEFHSKLNTAGQSDGVFELSVNGTLSARKTGLNWVGSYNAYGINAVVLENFIWAGAPGANNVRTLDNLVVSTQPIGCASTTPPPPPAPVSSVVVTPATSDAIVGQTVQLTAVTKDANGNTVTGRAVTWSSGNPSVASVNSTGLVTLQSVGSANILATSEGVTGQASVTAAPIPVATVTVTPATSSGNVGQTVQLTAVTKDANGNVLTGRAMTWATSSASIATVSSSGLVTRNGAGTATISATSEGKTGSASVTVTVPPAPVATVTVTPATSSGNVGQTVQLTAVTKDASGNTLTGRSITWATNAASVATVNASGLVTMNGAGAASISATSEGKSGTASVTVSAPPPGGTLANECASPRSEWIFCDDFETDRLAKYFEYSSSGGKFARTAATGVSGSVGMRTTYTVGQTSAGALNLAFGRTPSSYFRPADAGTANYREVYWRFYVRREAGWVGNGAMKLTRATIFAKADWSQAMIAHGWTADGDDRYLMIDPARGTDASGNVITVGYNDFNHLQWLGGVRSAAPEEDQAHVGQWACYEYHVKLNDAGQSNGLFEFRVNGQMSAQKTGMNWVGAYNSYGINAVFLENYTNSGAPAANKRTLDNFVVSAQPIGCGTP